MMGPAQYDAISRRWLKRSFELVPVDCGSERHDTRTSTSAGQTRRRDFEGTAFGSEARLATRSSTITLSDSSARGRALGSDLDDLGAGPVKAFFPTFDPMVRRSDPVAAGFEARWHPSRGRKSTFSIRLDIGEDRRFRLSHFRFDIDPDHQAWAEAPAPDHNLTSALDPVGFDVDG